MKKTKKKMTKKKRPVGPCLLSPKNERHLVLLEIDVDPTRPHPRSWDWQSLLDTPFVDFVGSRALKGETIEEEDARLKEEYP